MNGCPKDQRSRFFASHPHHDKGAEHRALLRDGAFMKNFAEKAKSHPEEHMTRIYGHLNFFNPCISVLSVLSAVRFAVWQSVHEDRDWGTRDYSKPGTALAFRLLSNPCSSTAFFRSPKKLNPPEPLHIYKPENKRFAILIKIVLSFHCALTC